MSAGCSGEVMKVLDEEGSTLTPFLMTLLLFLRETARGPQSCFDAYIQTLPTEPPPSLITWSIDERKLLRGSCAGGFVHCLTRHAGTSLERNVDRQLLEEAFDNQLLPLMKRHPDLWPSEICGIDRMISAAAMIQSRVFHMKEENWITNTVK